MRSFEHDPAGLENIAEIAGLHSLRAANALAETGICGGRNGDCKAQRIEGVRDQHLASWVNMTMLGPLPHARGTKGWPVEDP